jgi:hypothetical protein
MPPAPVTVSSRDFRRRRCTASISACRPMNWFNCVGILWRCSKRAAPGPAALAIVASRAWALLGLACACSRCLIAAFTRSGFAMRCTPRSQRATVFAVTPRSWASADWLKPSVFLRRLRLSPGSSSPTSTTPSWHFYTQTYRSVRGDGASMTTQELHKERGPKYIAAYMVLRMSRQ